MAILKNIPGFNDEAAVAAALAAGEPPPPTGGDHDVVAALAQADASFDDTPERALALASDTPTCGKLAESLRSAMRQIHELRTKIAHAEANPQLVQAVHIPGWQAKIEIAETKQEATMQQIRLKVAAMNKADDEKRPVSEAETQTNSLAAALIELVGSSMIDGSPEAMMRTMVPEIYQTYFRCGGRWYKRDGIGRVEETDEATLSELLVRTMEERQVVRTIGTAVELCLQDKEASPISARAVLKNWRSHLWSYTKVHNLLQTDESMDICNWLLPMEVDGNPKVLDRKTGALTDTPPEGCLVLYPAVTTASTGESRALDAMVAHHFKTQEEVDTFYRTCGISLFGYGIPNLVFLLGSGGSGKDALFSLMRAVHGEKLTVMLNSQALMGQDESNDLVRLNNARIALCAFESSHVFDGAFQPNTLKSITSGGMNPITARAKYARSAVDIHFKGSLWLYGNHVPNLTGGGDFDGLDRRFMVLPMRKRLPRVPPPAGFDDWADAIKSCAPVFAHRCLSSFMQWNLDGLPGRSDVRDRIPKSWSDFSATKLTSGSRFGFLTDIFQPDPYGLKVETVLDVMSVLMKSERSKLPRSKFLQVLTDTMSPDARFDGHKHMEPGDPQSDGHDRLPLTVVESRLHRWLDPDLRNLALAPLATDGGWQRELAEATYVILRSAMMQNARRYEGDEDDE